MIIVQVFCRACGKQFLENEEPRIIQGKILVPYDTVLSMLRHHKRRGSQGITHKIVIRKFNWSPRK